MALLLIPVVRAQLGQEEEGDTEQGLAMATRLSPGPPQGRQSSGLISGSPTAAWATCWVGLSRAHLQ